MFNTNTYISLFQNLLKNNVDPREEYHSCHTKVSRKDVRFFAIFFDLFPLFLDKKGTALWYKKLMKINVFALFSFANSISCF